MNRPDRLALPYRAAICTAAAAGVTLAATAAARAQTPIPTGYHLVNTISLPDPGGWDYIYCDSDGHRLYITRSNHVDVVNLDNQTLAGTIPDLTGIHGVAIDPKLNRGFVSDGGSASVTIFDTKTLQKISDVPVGQGPDCIIFDPATERVFTFNGRDSTSTAIDAATGKVVGTVTLPGRPEFAVADGKGHIYNNIEDKGDVVEIDARTLTVTHDWPLAPAASPSGIAMDRQSRRVFSVCDGGIMTVLNADTGKVVATPPIGNGPDACAFDPATREVFSSNGQDGTITVLHEDSPDAYSPIASVSTKAGARTMAVDTRTHHLFTVTATPAPPDPNASAAAPGQRRRRRYVDGSFVVLEYAPN